MTTLRLVMLLLRKMMKKVSCYLAFDSEMKMLKNQNSEVPLVKHWNVVHQFLCNQKFLERKHTPDCFVDDGEKKPISFCSFVALVLHSV